MSDCGGTGSVTLRLKVATGSELTKMEDCNGCDHPGCPAHAKEEERKYFDEAEAICEDLKGRIPINLREEIETAIAEALESAVAFGQQQEREAVIRLLEIHRLGLAETSMTVQTLNRVVEKVRARGQQEEA